MADELDDYELGYSADIDSQQAEIERLRTALSKIKRNLEFSVYNSKLEYELIVNWQIADDVLGGDRQ